MPPMRRSTENLSLEEQSMRFFAEALGFHLLNGEITPEFVEEFNKMGPVTRERAAAILWNMNEIWNMGTIINMKEELENLYHTFFQNNPEMARLIQLNVYG